MSSEDLCCSFCKPKKLFPAWLDLKAHLEQHVIEASAKRCIINGGCNCCCCCSTCFTCANPHSALAPESYQDPCKKIVEDKKIVELVRPVIQGSNYDQENPPSTSKTNNIEETTASHSNSPQQQPNTSSTVVNVKKKWGLTGSPDISSSAPLLLITTPQVEPSISQIHAPQHIYSLLPIEKKLTSRSGTEILPVGVEKCFIEGTENIGTLQNDTVLHSSPITKFSIIHSKTHIESLKGSSSCIKYPGSTFTQDFIANSHTSQEERRDEGCSVSRCPSVSNISSSIQLSEPNTSNYNNENVTVSDSPNLSGTFSPSHSSTFVVKNATVSQEHVCNIGVVVSPSQYVTSTNLSSPSNAKVFDVLGNSTAISTTASFNETCFLSSRSSPLSTSLVANPHGISNVCSEENASLCSFHPQKLDDISKLKVKSDFDFKSTSVTSAPTSLTSSCDNFRTVTPSICNMSALGSSPSLCSLEKIGTHSMQNSTLDSSSNLPVMSTSCEGGQANVTSSLEEELVDDPLCKDAEGGTPIEKLNLQPKIDKKIKPKCFECKKCDTTFSSKRAALLHHSQMHGKPRAFECEQCGRSFSSSHNLATHRRHRHGAGDGKPPPALCTVCGKSFASKSNLVLHARLHSGERPFVCRVCNKTFSRKWTLEKHSLYHKGERRFTCERCGAGFYTAHSLSRHIKLHDGERLFACDECDAKYVVVSDLKRHKLSHAAVKPFSCELCSKTFSRKHDLNVHALYHARSTRFRCEFCDRQFVEESNYRRHLRQHTGEKPYQCNECGVRYAQLHHVKNHLQTCHRDALKALATADSVSAAPLFNGAYSVPHSKARNRKGYLEKITATKR